MNRLNHSHSQNNIIMPSINVMRDLYRDDLASFMHLAFSATNPHQEYLPNWHIDIIADKLKQCRERKIRRLIINMPPRSLKSLCASVAFPAWIHANNPNEEIICASYADELVRDFSEKSRALMTSPQYQSWFPYVQLSPSKRQSINHINLASGGYRLGVSTGGAITGRGGDIIIIDDPLKASEVNTRERTRVNNWFVDNIYQRLNNKNDGVIIIVMQRLHEDDLTGFLLEQSDEWEVLKLPAIAEDNESYVLSDGGIYLRQRGEALQPERESIEQIMAFKQARGSYVFASQYQQEPAADGEALIRTVWFQAYSYQAFLHNLNLAKNRNYGRLSHVLGYESIIQSWDTALTDNENSDYSVCVTIGVIRGQYFVLDVYRDKLRFKSLTEAVITLRNKFQPQRIFIEDSPAGHHLIEALREEHIPIETYKPDCSKLDRLAITSGDIESGFVFLPDNASWKDDFVAEITRFPNTKHDDQVDAFTQAMIKLKLPSPHKRWFA